MGALLATAMTTSAQAEGGLRGKPGETYVMMGHPYWLPVFDGFKQAA